MQMSFVFAEKRQHNLEAISFMETCVYSDTKITFTGAASGNWCEKQAKLIEQYGMAKSIILSPECCISFAGNKVALANKLIADIYKQQKIEIPEIISMAFNIHTEADPDDIEFIICCADVDNATHITCIKGGSIHYDCQHAWIGSSAAFIKLEELFFMGKESAKSFGQSEESVSRTSFFTEAIHSCGDDTVGGFTILVSYREDEQRFVYPERVYSVVERQQSIKSGELLTIVDNAERGGFTIHSLESHSDAILELEQINRTIMYTRQYRFEKDVQNERYRYMMLPILVETSTGLIV